MDNNNTTPPADTASPKPAPAAPPTAALATISGANGFLTTSTDVKTMGFIARQFSESAVVPKIFQKDVGACLLALDMAQRINANPMLVMQNMYNVQGNTCWSGKLCIAMLMKHPDYTCIEWQYAEPGNWEKGVRVIGHRKDGRVDEGTVINRKMAEGEGWLSKPGSKWRTMPDQMAKYRSAAFFVRTFCPEVLMGMQTLEEVQDFADDKPRAAYGSKKPISDPFAKPVAKKAAYPDAVDITSETAEPADTLFPEEEEMTARETIIP